MAEPSKQDHVPERTDEDIANTTFPKKSEEIEPVPNPQEKSNGTKHEQKVKEIENDQSEKEKKSENQSEELNDEASDNQQEGVIEADQSNRISSALPKITATYSAPENNPATFTANSHSRSFSIISNSTIASKNSTHISFVKNFITAITEHKDVKKLAPLINSAKNTLDRLNNQGFDSKLVFETLKLAVESKITDIVILALDCFAKIFTFQLFEPIKVLSSNANTVVTSNTQRGTSQITSPSKVNLIDAAIETIANSFDGEGTDQKIEVQVVRALVAGVLNENIAAHGSTLLRAVRQIYNIFILSLSPTNQGIAQASLTQVVNVVFDKVEKITHSKTSIRSRLSSVSVPAKFENNGQETQDSPISSTTAREGEEQSHEEPLTLQTLRDLGDDEDKLIEQDVALHDENEQNVKDAFLLFRAMCKLSVKSLDNDLLDMRSHAVRSKLISLHIIHSIIKEHIDVFASNNIAIRSASSREETRIVDAIRQYLCLTIARNAASAISPVFETTLEIYWLIISNLRSQFKREIPVFLNEIYFPISELKTSTAHQKRYFLVVIQRLSSDPRALIEFYLNYDCDTSQVNVVEKLVNYLTKLGLTNVVITPNQKAQFKEHSAKSISTYNLTQLPMLSISKLSSQLTLSDNLSYPVEYSLKITALNSIVGILRSLNSWAQKGLIPDSTTRSSSLSVIITRGRSNTSGSNIASTPTIGGSLDEIVDPQDFENLKQRKTALQDGIRQFNFKPKRGIETLVREGFITNKRPEVIARFLLDQPGLDKAVIGEYLGEGDDENIIIMHAFVDLMDFANTGFVDAMRTFLQAFRLPGEAQKIDRFMLKFAERYVDGNPGVFANADTAYVLAYSVIMLNTDQHSAKIKNRMTIEEFIKNNRGIDDGTDLNTEFLTKIFNEISSNEIKLQSEQHAALLSGDIAAPQQQSFNIFNAGRDINREAYIQASKEISNKTEKLFKNLGRSKNSDNIYYSASHIEHVKSIFDTLWMSFLAALTTPFKSLDDEETIKICLEGLKLSISIATIFDLDYARKSFVGALAQFTNLSNVSELRDKNIEAMLLLLRVAEIYGNHLKESWKDVLTIISQVERLQLIAKGIDSDVVPDVTNARVHRTSLDSQRISTSSNSYFFGFGRKASLIEQAQSQHHNQQLSPFIAQRIISSDVSVAIDKIFTQSAQLNGHAIIDFIEALTEVSSKEIESSLDSSTPRTFSLQKVIDVCYYNMGRIRLEWSPIWAVIGGCLNDIGTKNNFSIVFFALDSLRQLSMRFLDIEELTGFKFQEEFLKPFDYILRNSKDIQITEMVLNCLDNLIVRKGAKIKSGWKSIFSALSSTAIDDNEPTVWRTYEIVSSVYKEHSDTLLCIDDAFANLINVLKQLTKNNKYQKISLHALKNIKEIVLKIGEITLDEDEKDETSLKHRKDIFKYYWYLALSGFNDSIMKGEDLEVRSTALNYLFDVLTKFGGRFDASFWDKICVNLLFPIFGVLGNHWEINQFNSHDDLSVWLSTTMIQALRNMIALFTKYFDILSSTLDGYLDLLISCICQENETISRIGRSCLQELIIKNVEKFEPHHWNKLVNAFERLFELTTAEELFEADPLRNQEIGEGTQEELNILKESKSSQNLNDQQGVDFSTNNGEPTQKLARAKSFEETHAKAKSKSTIVVKCILQLLMIETLSELFEEEIFYDAISYENLIKLSSLLEKSFRFARNFNDDYNLRVCLWNSGVIEKLPNLLKQESSSAAVFIRITFTLYNDSNKITQKQKDNISGSLIPMCVSIVERYVQFDDSTQQRNIITWRPVIVEILQGYVKLEKKDFSKNCSHVYDLVLDILDKSVPAELRAAIKAFFSHVGDVYVHEKK